MIKSTRENSSLVTLEVTGLLSKGAIMEIQLTPHSFVSQIFLVEKKDGGQRPVINLKGLNQFVRVEHFKIEGLHLLPDLLQSRDWMVKMDLKDAYLQVPSIPAINLFYLSSGRRSIICSCAYPSASLQHQGYSPNY